MQTFTDLTVFVVESCINCHVQFAMTNDLRKQRLNDGKPFFCPNGHSQYYSESTEARLRKQLNNAEESARFWRNQEQITHLSLRATKGQVTKLKRKAAAGQCPCCDQKFKDLQKHMEDQHPDFGRPEKDDQNN